MASTYRHISPTTVLIFTTLFVFSFFSLVNSLYRGHRHHDAPNWDLLIFTQNWPSSVCHKWSSEGVNHSCLNYPANTWTIHGIWPTKLGTIGPGFCKNSSSFSPEAIYGIEDQLMQVWAPVEKHKKKYDFWAHEWKKHGTCASILPALATEFDYFYKGIELIQAYNMNGVLQKAGIIPGQAYNVTQIWDGVHKVLNKKPQVVCFNDKENVSVLLEVRICFDKQLNLVDCDGTVVGANGEEPTLERRSGYQNLSNCLMEKSVQYPPGAPPKRHSLNQLDSDLQKKNKENSLIEKLKLLHFTQWFTI